MSKSISLLNLLPEEKRSPIFDFLIRLADKLLGIRAMDKIYQQNHMQGLSKDAFAQKLIDVLDLQIDGLDELKAKIPKEGPVVIASNHPFGGIEGVFLSLAISQVRPDLKVLANQGLQIFSELQDYFIFTNPLSEGDPKNGPSLRTSLKHVKSGGALLIFPSGRVSYYRKDKQRIGEHEWNRVVGRLINAANAQYLPVFVAGTNSPLFYRLGRIYYRLRMFMLARELLNKQGAKVSVCAGTPVPANKYQNNIELTEQAALCRAQSYAQDPSWRMTWPADNTTQMQALAEDIPSTLLSQEIEALPSDQHLLDYKDYSVYFGYQQQMPNVVKQIAKLRELVFREHNEGSGEPLDTDGFDATYTQLFIYHRQQHKIIGAYRMGRTDELLKDNDMQQLYLSRMFSFDSQFVNQQQACLELGRSFLIPEYQRSFQGLFLLWRGIGAFVCKFPHYRTLYGTVSLSKLYDPRSVALIDQAMVSDRKFVKAHTPFQFPLHPELKDFQAEYGLAPHLTAMLASIEQDGKDIPILAKHYQKLGAKFHCVGIDSNFNDTPGLLLSVDLANAPAKLLKLYLGDDWQSYRDYQAG